MSDTLATLIQRVGMIPVSTGRSVVIGIDGCGGAGKSSLAAALSACLPASAVVCMDAFYHPPALPPAASPLPAFDWTRLIEQALRPLRDGLACRYQCYDWRANRLANWCDVPSGGTVIVEGVTALRSELRHFYDLMEWHRLNAPGRLLTMVPGNTPRMQIRPAMPADFDAMVGIIRALPEWFTPTGQRHAAVDLTFHAGWVAEEEGRVVGFLTFFVYEAVAHIAWLGIEPAHQRRGLGRRLIEQLEATMRERGVEQLEVFTLGDSVDYPPYAQTRAFYRSLGFQDYKREKLDNPECPESLILRKPIRGIPGSL